MQDFCHYHIASHIAIMCASVSHHSSTHAARNPHSPFQSAQAALSYIRSNARSLGVPPGFYSKKEIHIHLPEGAIPKDGPSAGITMAMALISAASNRPARSDVAMTGEITLRGNVLAIGGLNEKLLAARRNGIRTVLIPGENQKDLPEIPARVREGLKIIPLEKIEDAIPHVFPKRS